jgi:hypothetical protein
MRIPRHKLYRAFPELDIYTDRQCEVLMRRVKLHPSAYAVIIMSMIGRAATGRAEDGSCCGDAALS